MAAGRFVFLISTVCFSAVVLMAQSGTTSAPQQPPPGLQQQANRAESGLEAPWDVQTFVAGIQQNVDRLRPLFGEMHPQQWYDQKGAPSTYILQLQQAQQQLSDIAITGRNFSQKTDSLAAALDEYFRLEALDLTTRSLEQGARQYGPRGLADRVDALLGQNFSSRERLRDYLRDLAVSTEQNFKIADQEAQRCRAMISSEPVTASKKTRKH